MLNHHVQILRCLESIYSLPSPVLCRTRNPKHPQAAISCRFYSNISNNQVIRSSDSSDYQLIEYTDLPKHQLIEPAEEANGQSRQSCEARRASVFTAEPNGSVEKVTSTGAINFVRVANGKSNEHGVILCKRSNPEIKESEPSPGTFSDTLLNFLRAPETSLRKRKLPPPTEHLSSAGPVLKKFLGSSKIEPRTWKYASLRSFRSAEPNENKNYLDDGSLSWSRDFAVIAGQRQELNVEANSEGFRWLNLCYFIEDTEQVLKIWKRANPRLVKRSWTCFMLWAMQHHHEAALKTLDVAISHSVPQIPRQIIGDCLEYLAAIYLENIKYPDTLKPDYIYSLTCRFAKISTPIGKGYSSIGQRTIYLILVHCRDEQVQALYRILCAHRIELYPFTLLHFLSRFSKMGDMPMCLRLMRRIANSDGIDMASNAVQSGCVKLLRAHPERKGWYNTSSLVLAELLKMGIRPKIFMYNIIILNSVEAGDYQVSCRLYSMAQENGLKPDAHTHRILLKGLDHGMDPKFLETIVNNAEGDGTLFTDDLLIRDLLQTSLILEGRRNWRSVFTRLLSLYIRYCDLRLLRELGLIPESVQPPSYERIMPSSRILGIMLIAYIRQNQFSDTLVQVYQRYHDLVKQGHRIVARLAETDHVANAFLMAFGRRSKTLEVCTIIVKSMIEPRQAKSSPTITLPFQVAAPTVQTWSILMLSFFRNGQTLAAEKVHSMMHDRGIEPDQVTWNILIRGHATSQDIDSTIDVLKTMQAAGFSTDLHTLKGLGKFRNRSRLMEALGAAIADAETEECQEMDRPAQMVGLASE